jgi:hypothetical protein
MSQILSWFRLHASAILATGVIVAKSGVLSSGLSALVIGIATAMGASV